MVAPAHVGDLRQTLTGTDRLLPCNARSETQGDVPHCRHGRVRMTIVDRTLDRMRVRAAYRINVACDAPSGRCYGGGNLAVCASLAMSEVETYRA